MEKHNDLEVYWECTRCGDMKFPMKFPTKEEDTRWPPGTLGGGSGPSAG
jgi:hypothetical protein